MQDSNISLADWMLGIYILITDLKGESSLRMRRSIGLAQDSAWHLGHRIREALKLEISEQFDGEVEVDETHIGGKAASMSHSR